MESYFGGLCMYRIDFLLIFYDEYRFEEMALKLTLLLV